MCEATLAAAENGTVPAEPAVTIGAIFRQYGPAYHRKYGRRMSRDQRKAMAMLEVCRTGELGSVVYGCKTCGGRHLRPRSCGNRHCPVCQGHKAKAWFENQLERLLPCPYFLMTFTVPKELRPFMRSHPRECYRALFDASAVALMELSGNPKYVGSRQLGFTGVLHTWGRTASYHPHVHYVVPGGAIGEDGKSWVSSRADFFVPVRAASVLVRAKFKAAMAACGLLDQIPGEVWAKPWIVHSKGVGDGRRALRYLAPYVFRVAMSNRRIVKCEPGPDGLGRVTFTYRKRGSRRYRRMTVTAEEFIRRFLQHVLPRGFQKVRHYGFAHPRRKIDREWLRMLVTVTLNLVYTLTVMAQPLRTVHRPICPVCGGELHCIGFLPAEDRPRIPLNSS
jgi:Putative transposase/Transposase zinc-binding domain